MGEMLTLMPTLRRLPRVLERVDMIAVAIPTGDGIVFAGILAAGAKRSLKLGLKIPASAAKARLN